MNLHFIPDNGFLNYFISITEKNTPAGTNRFVICTGTSLYGQPKKEKVKNENVLVAKYGTQEFYRSVGDLNRYEKIFIHFLNEQMCGFVVKQSQLKAKFYWLFWGADLYSPVEFFLDEIYDADSKKYFSQYGTFTHSKNAWINLVKSFKRKYFNGPLIKKQFKTKAKAIERIDYFLHYNSLDFETVKKYFPTRAEWRPFFYFEYDYAQLPFSPAEDAEAVKKKYGLASKFIIQLGHSASLSNNHLSALKWLLQFSEMDFEIVCPLSYGDMSYAQHVIRDGKKLFGDRFIPVTRYLSREDYLRLLQCVDAAVMNHLRTEAAGNIFMMLAMGKKVYCNENSNLFRFLQLNGLKIFLTCGYPDKENFFSPINETERKSNREKICSLFSFQKAEELIGNYI